MMAKKSFKKGVDNLIQSTGQKKEETTPAKKTRKPKAKNSQQESLIIDLGNSLTIDKVENIKQKIVQALDQYKEIKLESKMVEDIDITFLQMFVSLEKTKETKKANIIYDIKIPVNIKDLIEKSGYSRAIQHVFHVE